MQSLFIKTSYILNGDQAIPAKFSQPVAVIFLVLLEFVRLKSLQYFQKYSAKVCA